MLTKLFVPIALFALVDARDLYRVKRAPMSDMLTVVCRRQPDLKFCTSQGSGSPPVVSGPVEVSNQPDPPAVVEVATVGSVPQLVQVEPVKVVQVVPKVSTVNEETVEVAQVPEVAGEVPAQDRDAICKQYVYHFWFYCGNVEDHPKEMWKREEFSRAMQSLDLC